MDEWDEEERLNHNCYALGSQIDWTYSLIDDSRPGKGLAIHYKGGQECYKRVVEKTKTEGGRQKREVKWVPTPRSTTLLLRCSTTSRTGREAFERTMGKGARASEVHACTHTHTHTRTHTHAHEGLTPQPTRPPLPPFFSSLG